MVEPITTPGINLLKTFGKSDQDRRRLFSTVCHYFLSENVCISLDNEALFNDLMATLNSIKAGLKVLLH